MLVQLVSHHAVGLGLGVHSSRAQHLGALQRYREQPRTTIVPIKPDFFTVNGKERTPAPTIVFIMLRTDAISVEPSVCTFTYSTGSSVSFIFSSVFILDEVTSLISSFFSSTTLTVGRGAAFSVATSAISLLRQQLCGQRTISCVHMDGEKSVHHTDFRLRKAGIAVILCTSRCTIRGYCHAF